MPRRGEARWRQRRCRERGARNSSYPQVLIVSREHTLNRSTTSPGVNDLKRQYVRMTPVPVMSTLSAARRLNTRLGVMPGRPSTS